MALEKIAALTGYDPKKISEILWLLADFQKSRFCSESLSEAISFILVVVSRVEAHLQNQEPAPTPAPTPTPIETSKCRSCGAAIVWKKTTLGRWSPFDLTGVPHFATCPDANRWTKRRH